ncbi:MAG: putative transposase [Haloquadratum sp. J07HQX50]|jgi:transposase|nr:MAG: putative transposase [Haloquadratum sp. J07HQX50]
MRYNDQDGFEGEDVWGADTGALEGKYKDVLGASTAQTVRRANSEAWRGFLENKKAYHDESNTSVTEHSEPPGFRGNEDDRGVLKAVVRKDACAVEWGDRCRLEMVVGKELRDKHNSPQSRLRLEIVGGPN